MKKFDKNRFSELGLKWSLCKSIGAKWPVINCWVPRLIKWLNSWIFIIIDQELQNLGPDRGKAKQVDSAKLVAYIL